MSFGFSVSDIIEGYRLAFWIYDRCFTKAQGADVKYLQFGTEINHLGDSLQRLKGIIDDADRQRPQWPWHRDYAGPNTLHEVTGDFKRTLIDCEALLSDHSKFERSTANFVENVLWYSTTERDVNNLRKRVRFHVTKVALIAKPLETQLLLGISRGVRQIRDDLAELGGHPRQSFSIPDDLAIRFSNALNNNKPEDFEASGDLPLKETFDALVYNFAKSTVGFNPRPELGQKMPEEPQYLNLIKSSWIMKILEESPRFMATGSDSLWAEYMRELKDDIGDQFRLFDSESLIAPPAEVISRLPDSCFSIWVVEETSMRPPDLAEQRLFEEKILELTLPNSYRSRQSTLTIFRKSDTEMRLVSTTKDEQNKDFHREEGGWPIDMQSTRLVPAYASMEKFSTPTNNVLLCTSQGMNPIWYSLKDAGDVAQFQRALTGYRVFHDMANLAWSIEGSSKPQKSGKGRIQLWHYKPLPRMQPDGDLKSPESGSLADTRPQSPRGSQFVKRNSTGMSSMTLISTSSVASPVKGSRDDGTALMRPEVPVLIILTMCEKRYTFLHIQLNASVSIKPKLCRGRYPNRVVLGSDSRYLEIRRYRVEHEYEKGLYSWDLARARCPHHPEYKNLELMKKEYICLDFDTLAEKDEFCRELGLLENIRNIDLNGYEQKLREKKIKSNHPGQR